AGPSADLRGAAERGVFGPVSMSLTSLSGPALPTSFTSLSLPLEIFLAPLLEPLLGPERGPVSESTSRPISSLSSASSAKLKTSGASTTGCLGLRGGDLGALLGPPLLGPPLLGPALLGPVGVFGSASMT